jgi:integrase/recombinase XerD
MQGRKSAEGVKNLTAENAALFERFRQELVVSGYSQRTIKMYSLYLREFLVKAGKPVQEIVREDIVAFLAQKKEAGKASNATLSLVHAALRFFFHNLLGNKLLDEIKGPKKGRKLPVVLTKDEVRALIKATSAKRNRLIVEFLYSSGCRVSEAVNLRLDNINLKEHIATVRGGKGNKDRTIILSKKWGGRFKKYLARRKVKSPFVFSKKNGSKITEDTVQRMVRKAAKNAGILKEVTPHTLRHSYATHLLEAGENIRKIQELLGHSNLNTTQIYTQVSLDQLKKVKSPLDRL